MLDSYGFDLWADGYDRSVLLCEDDGSYPFAGYKEVLGMVYQIVREQGGMRILDVGFGTGILTQKLYQDGYCIYGLDFSDRMLAIAKEKMPDATLLKHDFSTGYPAALETVKFDCILSTYAFHHLDTGQKMRLIGELCRHLSDNGVLVIGDVAFTDTTALEACKKMYRDEWDEEEIYMVAKTLQPLLPNMSFHKITFCSGVFLIRQNPV